MVRLHTSPLTLRGEEESVRLEDVQYLLLDLLQLVLHLDDELLHGGMVALGAHGIDLTPYLLSDEAEGLPLPWGRLI